MFKFVRNAVKNASDFFAFLDDVKAYLDAHQTAILENFSAEIARFVQWTLDRKLKQKVVICSECGKAVKEKGD